MIFSFSVITGASCPYLHPGSSWKRTNPYLGVSFYYKFGKISATSNAVQGWEQSFFVSVPPARGYECLLRRFNQAGVQCLSIEFTYVRQAYYLLRPSSCRTVPFAVFFFILSLCTAGLSRSSFSPGYEKRKAHTEDARTKPVKLNNKRLELISGSYGRPVDLTLRQIKENRDIENAFAKRRKMKRRKSSTQNT